MYIHVHQRSACRICAGTDLRPFARFLDMPFTDDMLRDPARREFLADITVYWCGGCKTAQTKHDVEVGEYYKDYQYTVAGSRFARRFMELLAANAAARFGLAAGDPVIEVGSGDGVQLGHFQRQGQAVLGFEPSDPLVKASEAAGVPVLQRLFTADTVADIPPAMAPAKVILLTYTFDHLPDPLGFLEAVKAALDPKRGVVLLEVHDLDKIMRRRETCLFEHEHSIYTTAASMSRLLDRAGFELLTCGLVPEDDRRGNSLLVAAGLKGGDHKPDPQPVPTGLERYDDWAVYEQFSTQVAASFDKLRARVRAVTANGGRVAGYGAGGRGVMTLAQAGLTAADVSYLCDQNPGFHGLLAPKSRVPVVPPDRLRTDPVEEVIIFSYGYLNEIASSLADVTAKGTRLVSLLDAL